MNQANSSCPYRLFAADDAIEISDWLVDCRVLVRDEKVLEISRGGEGNMNLVLRVVTSHRSLIVKQSRPWVEKYPSIAAPVERIEAEIGFYRLVEPVADLAARTPRLVAVDRKNYAMVMQDLGAAADYGDGYAANEPVGLPLQEATAWLARLHSLEVDHHAAGAVGCFPLRRLNHAHLFEIPFRSPAAVDLDSLCPGFDSAAEQFRCDRRFAAIASRWGEIYLGDRITRRRCLLHGDFYPGSWLRSDNGLRIIDPEFCFIGPPEFDVGVLAAHSCLIGRTAQRQVLNRVVESYRSHGGGELDAMILSGFVGIEILRRLIGVAQLPLDWDLQQRVMMLEFARSLVLEANAGVDQ